MDPAHIQVIYRMLNSRLTWISIFCLFQILFCRGQQLLLRDDPSGLLLQSRAFVQHHVLEIGLQGHKKAHAALLKARKHPQPISTLNILHNNKQRVSFSRFQQISTKEDGGGVAGGTAGLEAAAAACSGRGEAVVVI